MTWSVGNRVGDGCGGMSAERCVWELKVSVSDCRSAGKPVASTAMRCRLSAHSEEFESSKEHQWRSFSEGTLSRRTSMWGTGFVELVDDFARSAGSTWPRMCTGARR